MQGFSRGELNPIGRSGGMMGSLGQTVEVRGGTQVPPAQPIVGNEGTPTLKWLG